MSGWVLETWRMLPNELNRKRYKICGSKWSPDGLDDDKIMYVKYGLFKDLLERLRSLEDIDFDPFKRIPEDEVCLEDVPG